MSGLVKATLQEIRSDPESTPVGDPVPVQFNPASLRLQLSNSVEGGKSRGRQARQFLGTSSTELSFDLVFDTADEDGGGGRPRSVREKTAQVERFVLPQESGGERQAPPKVRFQWGGLIIDGIISSLTIDIDHFAADGTPLRAKMGVSIREQDAKYELAKQGAAAAGGSVRSAAALAGESAAEFAARVGLDPGAWKELAAGIEGTLSLDAGLEIDFDAGLSLSGGPGISAGVEAGLSTSQEAAPGGVGATIQSVKITRAEGAAAQARQAFAASAPSPAGEPAAVPGAVSMPPASGSALIAAPRPPRVDPRAASFGFGVPLRPRVELSPEPGKGGVGPTKSPRRADCPCGCGHKGGHR